MALTRWSWRNRCNAYAGSVDTKQPKMDGSRSQTAESFVCCWDLHLGHRVSINEHITPYNSIFDNYTDLYGSCKDTVMMLHDQLLMCGSTVGRRGEAQQQNPHGCLHQLWMPCEELSFVQKARAQAAPSPKRTGEQQGSRPKLTKDQPKLLQPLLLFVAVPAVPAAFPNIFWCCDPGCPHCGAWPNGCLCRCSTQCWWSMQGEHGYKKVRGPPSSVFSWYLWLNNGWSMAKDG